MRPDRDNALTFVFLAEVLQDLDTSRNIPSHGNGQLFLLRFCIRASLRESPMLRSHAYCISGASPIHPSEESGSDDQSHQAAIRSSRGDT
jgi:hypothetical protein